MNAERIRCCVPFCGRTFSREKVGFPREIICGKHFRAIGPRTKQQYRGINRKLKKWPDDERLFRLHDLNWRRAKRQAIEAAAGLI